MAFSSLRSRGGALLGRGLREARQALHGLPPYPAAFALAVLGLCLVESATVRGPRPLAYVLQLTALALPVGATLGALVAAGFGLARALFARVPALHGLLWPAAGIASGLGLAASLGGFSKLGTHYDKLAKLTLAAGLVGGLGLGVLLVLLQPRARRPEGLLGGASPGVRAVAAVALVSGTAGLTYGDHTLYVGLYLSAHVALRLCAALLLGAALVICARELLLPRLSRRAWIALALLLCVPLATLDEDDSDVVQALVVRPWPATLLRIARSAFDLDRDGFSYVLAGGDCNELDRRVNPGAREIPGNGIDDNCLFGDREAGTTAEVEVPVPKKPSPMSVVLITVDTLRWDRFGGNDPRFGIKGRNTMPRLEAWAKHGVSFRNAYTSGAWTSIAIASLMRGVYARRLQFDAYYETSQYRLVKLPIEGKLAPDETASKMFPLAWEDPREPLAFWLKRRGMRTFGVIDDGFSQMLSSSLGIGRGFDSLREVNVEPTSVEEVLRERRVGRRPTRNDLTTTSMVITELRKYGKKKEPFFMWTHFFGAHTPSREHPGARKYGKSIEDQYDHEVNFVDMQVHRVLKELEKLKRPIAVFITSDHGEVFFPRYRSHGADADDEVLRVPMLARVPGWKPGVIDAPVSIVDLMPTILAVTQTPAPPYLDGIDLGRLVRGEKVTDRVLLSDTWQFDKHSRPFSELVAAFDGKHKVVLDRIDHSFSVYDQTDPDAPPLRVEGLANGKLARTILGYLEDTGGQLTFENLKTP